MKRLLILFSLLSICSCYSVDRKYQQCQNCTGGGIFTFSSGHLEFVLLGYIGISSGTYVQCKCNGENR